MERHDGYPIFLPSGPILAGAYSDPNALFYSEPVTEFDYLGNLEPIDTTGLDENLSSSTVGGQSAGIAQSEVTTVGALPPGDQASLEYTNIFQDAEFQVLTNPVDEEEEYHTYVDPTNLGSTHAAPGNAPSFQFPSPEVLPNDPHTVPIISSEYESYTCSWRSHGLVTECYHVEPDRSTFLRHLNTTHEVSGPQDAEIVCRLFDTKTGSVCNTPIKRGNFPRHVATHYFVRYCCQYCPGKSFSRSDSWKKHVKVKHLATIS